MEFSVGNGIAGIRIDAESSRGVSARDRVAHLPRDGDRSNPGHRVRKITEPFSEPQRRCVAIERVCSGALRARPTPFDAETDRHHELMFGVLEDAVFKGRLQVLKSTCSDPGKSSGWAEAAKGGSKGYREGLGNPFGEFRRYIPLPKRRIIAGFKTGHSGKA